MNATNSENFWLLLHHLRKETNEGAAVSKQPVKPSPGRTLTGGFPKQQITSGQK
jgi:hypothetical protein